MKQINYVNLTLVTVFSLIFLSCNKDSTTPKKIQFNEISDIATFHGNTESDIVVVHTQGGPITELKDKELNEFLTNVGAQSVLHTNVHQAQTRNPDDFKSSDITFEKAKEYDLQSVSNLKRVVDFFKSQKGKSVYVLGASFGAFVTQELIASYGVDIADGYLISVGRLDIDDKTWQAFSQGKSTDYMYEDNGNYIINITEDDDIEGKNMSKLAAGLGFNRYTDRFSNISSLSKVTYVYSDKDERVGPLSDQEVQFLKGKGANLILNEGATHTATVIKTFEVLKSTFNIE